MQKTISELEAQLKTVNKELNNYNDIIYKLEERQDKLTKEISDLKKLQEGLRPMMYFYTSTHDRDCDIGQNPTITYSTSAISWQKDSKISYKDLKGTGIEIDAILELNSSLKSFKQIIYLRRNYIPAPDMLKKICPLSIADDLNSHDKDKATEQLAILKKELARLKKLLKD